MNCKLIISARRENELERVKQLTENNAADMTILLLDLADADSLMPKVKFAEDLYGQIDIL